MHPLVSRLVLPCSRVYLKPAAGYARELALTLGFDTSAADMLYLAVEEAALNVIEHGFARDATASFELVFEETGLGLTIRVKEKGMPFDPKRLEPKERPVDLNGAEASGLGGFLMRRAVDELAFRNLGREGKELVLTKYLPAALRRAPEPDAAPGESAQAEPRKNALYEVRPLRPEDAPELARCAYRTYGYNYDEYIYYPERILSLMRAGLLHPVAAVTPEGELVAYGALKLRCPHDPTPEAGAFFVDPALQGAIVYIQLCNFVFDLARRLPGVKGVFIRNVTGHVLAQKAASAFGFKDCGLLVGPAANDPDSSATRPRLRETRALAYYPLEPGRFREIYPSPNAKPFVERVFKNLEFPFLCREQPAVPEDLPDCAELETELSAAENTAEIRVRRHGRNTLAEVAVALRRCRLEGADAIVLRLDLEDPGTGYFGRGLEALGFLFCGVLPDSLPGENGATRDALLLQYPNSLRIDYEAVQLFSTFSRDVLEHARAQDPNAE
jgi:serine/threonine-protein kinase RsbW